jgi:hypothetical protein
MGAWLLFSCSLRRHGTFLLGLSLTALSPAAAWYFIVIVCCFFTPLGEKTTHEELKTTGKRKS